MRKVFVRQSAHPGQKPHTDKSPGHLLLQIWPRPCDKGPRTEVKVSEPSDHFPKTRSAYQNDRLRGSIRAPPRPAAQVPPQHRRDTDTQAQSAGNSAQLWLSWRWPSVRVTRANGHPPLQITGDVSFERGQWRTLSPGLTQFGGKNHNSILGKLLYFRIIYILKSGDFPHL